MSGWKLGRIAGIDVRMHWTFLLLLGWIAVSFAVQGDGMAAALWGSALLLSVFGCVLLHELGHALAARPLGIKTRDITLLPIGGLARLDRMPRDPKQELWIAVAGPLVNVVIAAGLFGVLVALNRVEPVVPETLVTRTPAGFVMNLMWLNVLMVAFNLLPAFPMDGGRVLRALLGFVMDYRRATEIAAASGQAMAMLFAIAGLFFNPWLLLIALFVFVSAGAEASQVRFREITRHLEVSDAMMTDFRTLSPDDPLSLAAEVLLAGAQQDFPVVNSDDGEICGVLRRQTLIREICDQNGYRAVGDVMDEVTDSASPYLSLNKAVQQMQETEMPCLPVRNEGRIIGVLTMENIGELIMLRGSREQIAQTKVAQTSSAETPPTDCRTCFVDREVAVSGHEKGGHHDSEVRTPISTR